LSCLDNGAAAAAAGVFRYLSTNLEFLSRVNQRAADVVELLQLGYSSVESIGYRPERVPAFHRISGAAWLTRFTWFRVRRGWVLSGLTAHMQDLSWVNQRTADVIELLQFGYSSVEPICYCPERIPTFYLVSGAAWFTWLGVRWGWVLSGITIQTQGLSRVNQRAADVVELLQFGYSWTSDPETADIVILNTCSVRKTAEQKALGFLGNLKYRKKRDTDLIVAVGGCLTQNPEVREFLLKAPFVNVIFGTRNFHRLPELLQEVQQGNKRVVADERVDLSGILPAYRADSVKAYVTIMYGCNNFCSYCIVPYTRGREKSRPAEEINEEVAGLAAAGYKEVMLLGQNVNSYGRGLDSDINFAKLLEQLDEIVGIARIRYMTSHPRDFTDELIETIASSSKICEHFHLPIQSGSNRILKLMNRGYSREKFIELTEKIRKRIPESSITTDIIVGFPGETEDDFQDTLDLVEQVKFDAAFTFLYSPRQGTPAEKMEEQISQDIKRDRMIRLTDIQNKITLEHNQVLENKVVEVLVEGRSKKDPERWSGRTRTNKIVVFNEPDEKDLTGELIDVMINCARTWNLVGTLI
jgi:tRNA-2-methylthio-N6-dimethylallyladenosine synthase